MKNTEAAYIAGLMDGEGSFYIERFASVRSPIGFQYRVVVTITMCDKATIEFICKLTGKGFRAKRLPSGRTAYILTWSNGPASSFIKLILKYLQNKKEQAEWCLLFNSDVAPGRGSTYTKENFKECEFFYNKLKELKR